MGPSGSGKSTVGALLAERLGTPFIDADDLHPARNIAKMSRGIPLDDDDRMPWLQRVGRTLQQQAPLVLACSALTRRYRDVIRAEAPDARFVELVIDRRTLVARMRARADHFMPASLLDSQLGTLESLAADEAGVRIDGARADAGAIAAAIAETLPASVLAVARAAHREQGADGEHSADDGHQAEEPGDAVGDEGGVHARGSVLSG
ncbi:gluconokinase [Microbacterium sp. KUDC0406]|nr:gluconokinase [Microbacterium sp. KUDC0406]